MKTMMRCLVIVFVSLNLFFLLSAQNIQSQRLKSFSKTSSGVVDTAWVRHYASRLIHPSDEATAITSDVNGNIYVTGRSEDELVTVKYNSNGATVWVAYYNETRESFEKASAIAVDVSGNVYVTGWGGGSMYYGPHGGHYLTVKYNPAGIQQWVAQYDGTETFLDYAIAIVVDASGNVYVAGTSGYDYATIKYNSNGDSLWVARYNRPGNSWNEAVALTLDATGNVYVTGSSGTIKYNSSGVQQWAANQSADAVTVDSTGNVYVTGSGGTVKYNSNGVQQWIKNQSAHALAVDASRNVYVSGMSGSNYTTVKYNSNGDSLWGALYKGLVNYNTHVVGLALDGAGYVYVSGTSGNNYTTVKYNSNGDSLWIARLNGPLNSFCEATATTIDVFGNVYVTGKYCYLGMTSDYATVKYNSTGAQQWVAQYDGPTESHDVANAFAIDSSGNMYITGISEDSVNSDYSTVKYNSAGVQQWVARYDGVNGFFTKGAAVTVDASGYVYVTGTSSDSGTGNDYVTIKYNPAGIQQWSNRYNGPGNSDDDAIAITVDIIGNVYVTGNSVDTAGNSEYATVKYNSTGVKQWVASYTGGGATAIAVDASGYVYVTGSSDCFATIKYNSNGDSVWVARYIGPEHNDNAIALAIDASGNVYVTGSIYGIAMGWQYATIKYNNAGIQQWVARDNGEAADLIVDVSGNVYVTGNSGTVKYNSNGVKEWVTNQSGNALTVDAPGNVYVTTSSDFNWGSVQGDYKTIKYNPAGIEQWVAIYNGPGNNYDIPIDIAVDRTGNVYVAGTSVFQIGGWGAHILRSIFTTIKYIQTPTSVNQYSYSTPDVFMLDQNYPNPFNPSTTIIYSIPERSNVRLSIFNTLGQNISEIMNETKDAGSYEYSFNASQLSSGIYFYRIEATSVSNSKTFVETKKMVLMR
jgi:uncharacterized delta-60 repeat protein